MKIKEFILTVNDGLSDIWKLRQRGKRDADRHKERLRKAAKDNMKEIISSEDIISTDGSGKKIKIPVKYLEQWRFKHGNNKKNHGVGHGGQGAKPGDILGQDPDKSDSNKAGDKQGDMLFEEFSLDEIINMMMEDLNLPWLEDKPEKVEIETETILYNDVSKKGLMPNLDIRRTLKENLKRNAAKGSPKVGGFKQDDLRYKTYDIQKDYRSNAAVYLIMDRSGSMTTEKKYIAKSFFFWMVQFIKKKYKNVELVFIAHDTEAYLCNENDFFTMAESGGTKCSSGFDSALKHIKHYHPQDSWNNYVFAFSDGDNYEEDNKLCVELVKELLDHVNAIGYGEIMLEDYSSFMNNTQEWTLSTLNSVFKTSISSSKFMSVNISKKDDVYKCLKQFFGLKEEAKK